MVALFLVLAPLFSIKGKKPLSLRNSLPIFVFLITWVLARWMILPLLEGVLVDRATYVVIFVALLMVIASSMKNPTVRVAVLGAILARVGGVVGGIGGMDYFSLGFFAMLCQGLSHDLSGELTTLMQLEKGEDARESIGYTYAHVTYFPALLIHSCRATFLGF
eukprot:TRINITY_DN980_c0_g1_i1.p1 TRINITY_DN980_c0_g1~~TRINITY_DN980_c0_g1_i1.p1  ORF type:complete len:163 (-),score=33.98 TRINITY_DN980_c0_g1_i1:97-585(-)